MARRIARSGIHGTPRTAICRRDRLAGCRGGGAQGTAPGGEVCRIAESRERMQPGATGRQRQTVDCGAQAQPVRVESYDGGGVILSTDAGWDGDFCRDSRKDGSKLKHNMKRQINTGSFAANTKFSKLYGGTYWGSFKYEGNPEEKEICANRNAFAEAHRLNRFLLTDKVFWRLKNYFSHQDLDHAELYRCGIVGVLLLVSNYGGPPPSILGMKECPSPLYSFKAKSYFRRWETKEHFEKHLKALMDLIDIEEILNIAAPKETK